MFDSELFKKALVEPALELGADSLNLVSGYATSTMVQEHIRYLKDKNVDASINLIIGMVKKDGIEKSHHLELVKLASSQLSTCHFSCRYVLQDKPVHAKVYAWLKGGQPLVGFVGSANYTLAGFGVRASQIEVLAEADPQKTYSFYQKFYEISKDCNDSSIKSTEILREPPTEILRESSIIKEPGQVYKTVKLSLLTKTGEIAPKSGLNWGQREGRDRDQAYIPVRAPVNHTNFFPLKKPFAVLTDDGQSFVLVRVQDDGKALETPDDNSIIGKYFRNRIGVENGAFVYKEDLENYGRTDVTFAKIDDETFYMDFSSPVKLIQQE